MDERATLKDKDSQDYYDRMFALFATPEWKEFQQEVERFKEGRPTLAQIPDARVLHFVQGQMDVIAWIETFADRVEKSYKLMLDAEAAPAADADDLL